MQPELQSAVLVPRAEVITGVPARAQEEGAVEASGRYQEG